MYNLLIILIIIFIILGTILLFQIWKGNKIRQELLTIEREKRTEEILKERFPNLYKQYKDSLKEYIEKFNLESIEPNHPSEIYEEIWENIVFNLKEKLKNEKISNFVDSLRQKTKKIIGDSKNRGLNKVEASFLAYLFWNVRDDNEPWNQIDEGIFREEFEEDLESTFILTEE